MTIKSNIAIGTYQLTVTYTDSAPMPGQAVLSTVVIATDECLTDGLVVPYTTGDFDMSYIVEDPTYEFTFDGIENGECQYTVDVEPVLPQYTLAAAGLHFEPPVHSLIQDAFPLVDTYSQDSHSYIELYSNDYDHVDLVIKLDVIVKSIIKSVEVDTYTFQITITYVGVYYCTSQFTATELPPILFYRLGGDPSTRVYDLDADANDC